MDLDVETQLYITAGVLGAACLLLIILLSVLYTRVKSLSQRVDGMQNAGKLRVQKLKVMNGDKNHAFHNPALAPDEELSKRGYSMYQPSEPDVESARETMHPERISRGPDYVEELTRELDHRHSTAPSFLLTAIQENKRKSKHLNNPMAKEARENASDTNPNFMY